ncbi:MAG: DUF1127 domain-containing protein [Rhodospirillales bacterium]|nr:DUF1127 domain-containing protein [Rhodospirillales bacterium]
MTAQEPDGTADWLPAPSDPALHKEAAMTVVQLALSATRRRQRRAGWRALLSAWAARWQQARRLRQARRYILEMDEHMLSDIGVSRAQALFEIDRRCGK